MRCLKKNTLLRIKIDFPRLRRLSQRLKGFTSDREELERLHSENGLAVLSGTTSMEYEMFLQQKQETYISKEPFVHGYYSSWMFGKGFPLQRNISAFLARTFETGIYQKVSSFLASKCQPLSIKVV